MACEKSSGIESEHRILYPECGAIDAELAEDAAILTAIGMGTAFGLLVGLLVMVVVMTKALKVHSRLFGGDGTPRAEREARSRAVAATAAVGALLGRRSSEGDGG